MRKLIFPILLLVAFVLEAKVNLFGVTPNFTVLFVYYIGLRHGHMKGLAGGALVGLLADSASGAYLGPGLLAKATVGYLAQYLRKGMFIWTPPLGIAGVAVLTALDGLITYICISVFFDSPAPVGWMAMALFAQAAMNTIAGMFIRPPEDEDIEN